MFRIGQGYDVHALVKGRPLILGGVHIPFKMGLLGHSDADALLHAIADGLLGAVALGDIGCLFPDSEPVFRDIDSRLLLRQINNKLLAAGWSIVNVDSTIITEAPKLAPFIDEMRTNIAHDLQLDIGAVNIKSKTNEKFGYLGNQEAIEAQAIVLCCKTP